MSTSPGLRIVGDGRAGGSFARALTSAGWSVDVVGRRRPVRTDDVDGVLLAVPDAVVAEVAAEIAADAPGAEGTVVLHCAGSLRLDALGPHRHRGSVHPLVSLPGPEVGAVRLRGGWFAVAASDDRARRLVDAVVAAVTGRAVTVDDDHRAGYHAAAAIASNHLVALLGQVERVAASVGVPLEAYLALAQGSLDNVASLGPAAALTGPVARGDWATVRSHVLALPAEETSAYLALVAAASRLAGRDVPPDLTPGAGADGSRRGGDAPAGR
jgi:predicted short-subunit dehydrogenase-like oxidoreductase (DUF2520 family)